MFNFKVILMLALVTPGILALKCREAKEITEEVVEPQTVSNENAEVKINWGPVWDDQEGHHEFVNKNIDEDLVEEYKNCDAPNGLGLKNLFIQVDKILPKEQIKNIVKSYAEDTEVKALKAFVRKPQTVEKIKAIHHSLDYQILKDYSCRILHIDLVKYNQLARTLIKPTLVRTTPKGIRGLINAVDAILPRQELRDLYKNLLASDEELVKAVANLKSEKFHQLLLNVRNNVPEYKELTKELSALGVPIEEIREQLANSLGWAPEMGVLV